MISNQGYLESLCWVAHGHPSHEVYRKRISSFESAKVRSTITYGRLLFVAHRPKAVHSTREDVVNDRASSVDVTRQMSLEHNPRRAATVIPLDLFLRHPSHRATLRPSRHRCLTHGKDPTLSHVSNLQRVTFEEQVRWLQISVRNSYRQRMQVFQPLW